MKGRISTLPRARRDSHHIADAIAKDNLDAACRFYDMFDKTADQLLHNPKLGVVRNFSSSRLKNLRMLPIVDFDHWLLFYRPDRDGIEIVRILHSSQNVIEILGH